ncbi:hypothetical protein SPI_08179 [Niveomyces insectorum RCEF 264]|uniref:Uncharacterized protein n=1 Tax=Niveomyces insectorum RCEF 264 TaxID=1081102 RepID=A0A162ID81_9HYPO|nr:hypothetical protein SPI_08179 [Niveomyces insectorum RCEF 264]
MLEVRAYGGAVSSSDDFTISDEMTEAFLEADYLVRRPYETRRYRYNIFRPDEDE